MRKALGLDRFKNLKHGVPMRTYQWARVDTKQLARLERIRNCINGDGRLGSYRDAG